MWAFVALSLTCPQGLFGEEGRGTIQPASATQVWRGVPWEGRPAVPWQLMCFFSTYVPLQDPGKEGNANPKVIVSMVKATDSAASRIVMRHCHSIQMVYNPNWYLISLVDNLNCLVNPINLSIHLSVCLYIYLSVCLSVCPSVCLSVCLSLYRSVSLYPSICLSVYLSICLSIYRSIHPSIHLSIYPSIHLSIYPSIDLSIDLSIYLCIYLSISEIVYLYIFIYMWICIYT